MPALNDDEVRQSWLAGWIDDDDGLHSTQQRSIADDDSVFAGPHRDEEDGQSLVCSLAACGLWLVHAFTGRMSPYNTY